MAPTRGEIDHLTPVLALPVTVAVNCWACAAPSDTLPGVTETPTPLCGTISMAFTVGVESTGMN
jgi:hypothetical protein